MNYLTPHDPDAHNCAECGAELPTKVNFCDHCGAVNSTANAQVAQLSKLHRDGHLDGDEYLAALRIQTGRFDHPRPAGATTTATVKKRRSALARLTETRVGTEIAVAAAVVVAMLGFSAGAVLSGNHTSNQPNRVAGVALTPALDQTRSTANIWNVENFDATTTVDTFNDYWLNQNPTTYVPPRMINADTDEVPEGCGLDKRSSKEHRIAIATWCPDTDTVTFSPAGYDELADSNSGNGIGIVHISRVFSERAEATNPATETVDSHRVECNAGAAIATFTKTYPGGGDIELAILRAQAIIPYDPDNPTGSIDRTLDNHYGYLNGAQACATYRPTTTDRRIGARRSTNAVDPKTAAATIDVAADAFAGVGRTQITPDELKPGICDVDELYAAACDDGIGYNPSTIAAFRTRHGTWPAVIPIAMAYTSVQQRAAESRTGIWGQYCGVGAIASAVQKANDAYGLDDAYLIVGDLDETVAAIAAEINNGGDAYNALDAIATGFRQGAKACL